MTEDERQRLSDLYARLPQDDADLLLLVVPEWRAKRILARDRQIQAVANFYPGMSARARSAAIAHDLDRCLCSRAPVVDQKRAMLARILRLNGGSPLSGRTINEILRHQLCAENPEKLHTGSDRIAS